MSTVVDESDPMRHLNDLEETSEGHAAERRTNYWENAVINYGEQVQTVQMSVNLGQPQLRPVRALRMSTGSGAGRASLWIHEADVSRQKASRYHMQPTSCFETNVAADAAEQPAPSATSNNYPVVETAQLQQRPVKYNSTSIA